VNIDERRALRHLDAAKNEVKEAFRALDAAPMDPATQGMLRVLDMIDVVGKAIKDRELI
jgi:hypothetical protein